MSRSKNAKIPAKAKKKAAREAVEPKVELAAPPTETAAPAPADTLTSPEPVTEGPAPVGAQETSTAPPPSSNEPPAAPPELDELRAQVEQAKAEVEKTEAAARTVEENARAVVARAREAYRTALVPYRDACKKAGVPSEYELRGRSPNVTERVSFLVELAGDSVRIAIKGKPESEEVFPLDVVRASPNKTARTFTDRQIGPKETKGNKCGSLGNRLRAILAKAGAAVAS